MGVIFKELFHESLGLALALELLVESEGHVLCSLELDSLSLLLLDDGLDVWLEGGEETWCHLQLKFQLRHGSRHEVVVALLVEELKLCEVVSSHILVELVEVFQN